MSTQEVESKALNIIQLASQVTIIDNESYLKAGELWKNIKNMKDQVNESFKPIIEKAHAAHKEALAQKAKIFDPLDQASRTVKSAMEKYQREEQEKQIAEQKRIEEQKRKIEEEKRLQEALNAENSGDHQKAEAILAVPVNVPSVKIDSHVPKMQGGPVYREVWKMRIVDENLLPREMLIPDVTKLNLLARTMKEKFSVPGAESYSERV